jgi:hypothetical protein
MRYTHTNTHARYNSIFIGFDLNRVNRYITFIGTSDSAFVKWNWTFLWGIVFASQWDLGPCFMSFWSTDFLNHLFDRYTTFSVNFFRYLYWLTMVFDNLLIFVLPTFLQRLFALLVRRFLFSTFIRPVRIDLFTLIYLRKQLWDCFRELTETIYDMSVRCFELTETTYDIVVANT